MATSFGNVQKTGLRSWKLTVSGGFDGGGKRIRHTKTVHVTSDNPDQQEKEAKKQLALFQQEIEKGQLATSGKMTLNEYFAYWLTNYAAGRHAPGTIFYNQQLFKRIGKSLGHKRLDQIQPKHLLTFYKNLSEPGIRSDKSKNDTLSSGTVRKYHVLLHSLLGKATQWQFILPTK